MRITNNTRETLLRLSQTLLAMTSNANSGRKISEICEERGVKYLTDHIIVLVQTFENNQNTQAPKTTNREAAYEHMLPDIIGRRSKTTPRAVERQIERLKECLSAMPDNQMYEAVMKEYTGDWPEEPCQPGIFEQPGCDAPNMPDFDLDLNRAKTFLTEKTRVTYIADGTTDLTGEFSDTERRALNDLHVYVLRDIARLTDNDILSVANSDRTVVKLIAALYNCRQTFRDLQKQEDKA